MNHAKYNHQMRRRKDFQLLSHYIHSLDDWIKQNMKVFFLWIIAKKERKKKLYSFMSKQSDEMSSLISEFVDVLIFYFIFYVQCWHVSSNKNYGQRLNNNEFFFPHQVSLESIFLKRIISPENWKHFLIE